MLSNLTVSLLCMSFLQVTLWLVASSTGMMRKVRVLFTVQSPQNTGLSTGFVDPSSALSDCSVQTHMLVDGLLYYAVKRLISLQGVFEHWETHKISVSLLSSSFVLKWPLLTFSPCCRFHHRSSERPHAVWFSKESPHFHFTPFYSANSVQSIILWSWIHFSWIIQYTIYNDFCLSQYRCPY